MPALWAKSKYPNIISVGGVDLDGNRIFSHESWVKIFAPAKFLDVPSRLPNYYETDSGTTQGMIPNNQERF